MWTKFYRNSPKAEGKVTLTNCLIQTNHLVTPGYPLFNLKLWGITHTVWPEITQNQMHCIRSVQISVLVLLFIPPPLQTSLNHNWSPHLVSSIKIVKKDNRKRTNCLNVTLITQKHHRKSPSMSEQLTE